MIRKILSLFLILVAVGAGLCSAQTAGKKSYLAVSYTHLRAHET